MKWIKNHKKRIKEMQGIDLEILLVYGFFESMLFLIILCGYIAKQEMRVPLDFYFLVYCPFCILVVNTLILILDREIKTYKVKSDCEGEMMVKNDLDKM